jgi:hypothetical protein
MDCDSCTAQKVIADLGRWTGGLTLRCRSKCLKSILLKITCQGTPALSPKKVGSGKIHLLWTCALYASDILLLIEYWKKIKDDKHLQLIWV